MTEPVITALSDPAQTPPFELWRPALQSGLAATLDHASVAWRHPRQRAKWQIAAASMAGFRNTLDSMGFTEIQSPKLVESATESGANVFPVDFFGRPAYPLSVETPSIPTEVPVIDFADALRRVGAAADEPDLAPEHERTLGDWALKEFGSDVLAVQGYPMRKRPFYTCPQPGDDRWSNSFDLLFRGIELVAGGQRLHRYADYVAAIEARGEDPDRHRSYLETFRHGMPPHGGFAVGLERWTARLIGAPNIREVTLFPRDIHRLTP